MPFGFGRKPQSPEPSADPSLHRAGDGLAADLLTKGGATREAIGAAEVALGCSLPASLAEFIAQADVAEGWVAGAYLAFWPIDQLAHLNTRAKIAEYAPDLVAFATNAGGEGYFFEKTTGNFINSPMIGLGYIDRTPIGRTLGDFMSWLAAENPRSGKATIDPSRFGLVIHEITPILFGGSPTDPKNKAWLPLETYTAAVGFWNDRRREAQGAMANAQQSANHK